MCYRHGGNAPQVRAAAALRVALMVDPALKVYDDILKDKTHPQRFVTARDILDRNNLTGTGAPPKEGKGQAFGVTVQTQVNLPEPAITSMSDQELGRYKALLLELRALAPKKDEPKRLGTVKV